MARGGGVAGHWGGREGNKDSSLGNSPAVKWLGLHAFTAESVGSIPGQGTKIPLAMQHGQKKIKIKSEDQKKKKKNEVLKKKRIRQLTSNFLVSSIGRGNGNALGKKTSCTPNLPPQNVSSDTFAFGGLIHIGFIPFLHGHKQILISASCSLYSVLIVGVMDVNEIQSLTEEAHTIR